MKGNLISCYLQQQQQQQQPQIIAIKINNNNRKNSIKLVNMSTKPYKKQKTSAILLKRTFKGRRRVDGEGGLSNAKPFLSFTKTFTTNFSCTN